ncbi:MAG: transcriptional repressor [Nanoarchaeota archaeon]|nr:transcriptional repressor [Nanoarchaeota archaeon]
MAELISRRLTSQKTLLQQELDHSTTLFDAEELYAKAVKKNSAIGIATVYRFLRECVDAGKLHSYSCDRKTIYSTSKNNHSHFRCEKCASVHHIDIKKLDFLPVNLRNMVCHVQIDITGICISCQAKNK